MWRKSKLYPQFEANELGDIRRLPSSKKDNYAKFAAEDGYVYLNKYKMGGYDYVSNNVAVHRIVASAFLDNPENKPTVNHINGIKDDNRVENLEWATQAEQIHHAVRTGLLSSGYTKSEEVRKHMSAAKKGQKNPMYGKHHVVDDATRHKMSEAMKGNKNNLGHHHSEETRKRLSESKKGSKNPMYGKKMSEVRCAAAEKSRRRNNRWDIRILICRKWKMQLRTCLSLSEKM